jgi:hypothetical protein
MEGLDGGMERETAVARLDAGVVEYRLDRRGEATVLVFHGGHMRAGLPLASIRGSGGLMILVRGDWWWAWRGQGWCAGLPSFPLVSGRALVAGG